MTECKIFKKLGFSLRESGVGGSRLDVPIARVGLGGMVGRRVRIWKFIVRGSGKTYWRGMGLFRWGFIKYVRGK